MKRKITAVLLCIALLLMLSVNASADVLIDEIQSIVDTPITPIADEITVNVDEEGVQIAETEILNDNTVMPLAQTTGIVSGGVYRIKNVGSGKYMNVHYGIDANGTNVYQWTADGSTEQKFRVVYSPSQDSYMIFAMCSSNGSNRVLEVTDGGGALAHGQNIKLYSPTASKAQRMKIIPLGQNQYRIAMTNNRNLYLAAYGNSNGSSGGTGATSAGNIYLSNYVGEMYQHWMFEAVDTSTPTPVGYLENVSTNQISGWAYQSDVPDAALTVHIYITNNSTGEEKMIITMANIYRVDLIGYGDGEHGFSYNINWKTYKPGTYTVRAYALGMNSSNPQLTNVKTFTVRNIVGTVDYLNNSGIGGWVWKPDAPNSAIDVHIYIYKSDGTQVARYTTVANQARSDLAAAGYGNGAHGFSYTIDWSTFPEERLQVVAYALDGSNHNPQFYSGYYYNGVEEPTTNYVWPTVSKRITQNFKAGTHYGIDIGAVTAGVAGDPIYCFADGYVIRSGWSTSYGNVVYVNHTNPKPSISLYIQTKYAHMRDLPLLDINTNISKGTVIGYMGTTGQSNGVHLHFETVMVSSMTTLEMWANGVIDKSKCIDPLNYFDSSGNVLTYNINSSGTNENQWGLIFDINDIEIDIYDRIGLIDVEQPVNP